MMTEKNFPVSLVSFNAEMSRGGGGSVKQDFYILLHFMFHYYKRKGLSNKASLFSLDQWYLREIFPTGRVFPTFIKSFFLNLKNSCWKSVWGDFSFNQDDLYLGQLINAILSARAAIDWL